MDTAGERAEVAWRLKLTRVIDLGSSFFIKIF